MADLELPPGWRWVAAGSADLKVGRLRRVRLGVLRQACLANVGGRLSAVGDRCTHAGNSLSAGRLEGGELVCAAHGYRYDPLTGDAVFPPIAGALPRYPVAIRDGQVWVGAPPDPLAAEG